MKNTTQDPSCSTINRRAFLVATAASLLGPSCTTQPMRSSGGVDPPNIVVILADDYGVADIEALFPDHCNVPSPNLDRLVSESMTFIDAHAGAAVCTPTRYGLLTGRYSWRTCLQSGGLDTFEPPLIARDCLTLPAMLRNNGYHTACIGKWHLGWDWPKPPEEGDEYPDFTAPIESGPTERGFDYYFGTDVPNHPPFTFIENDRLLAQPTDFYPHDPPISWGMKPGPMEPGWRFDQILPAITQRATEYIHERAKKESPFFLYFSMTTPHEPITPSPQFEGKSGIAPIADLLMETDWSAGQIINAIDEADIADKTLLIFTGDNGHNPRADEEILVEYGHYRSGPYRGSKFSVAEGGHREPFIVRWPGVVPPGATNNDLVCINDIMATCADILDQPLPPDSAEDSVSFLPALRGANATSARETLINHGGGGDFAIRQGPWKLTVVPEEGKPSRFLLYNLDQDPGEAQDQSVQNPGIVRRLHDLLRQQVDQGRSTPGPPQPNDTTDLDIHNKPPTRYGRPI